MFYKVKLKDYVDLSPQLFEADLNEAIRKQLDEDYAEFTSEDFGLGICVMKIDNIGQGFKLPEVPTRQYVVEFTLLAYMPELHEVIEGEVSSVTNFGVFVNMGVLDGLVHLSQTMVDQVSFSKVGSIQGSKTGQTLKAGDDVRASTVAVSFRDLRNVKIGLTMRQPGLGAIEWIKNLQES